MDFGGGDEIRFERMGLAAVITLTRPAALNALTHKMVKALTAALEAWRTDPNIALVVVRGEGRAFSAGGDLMLVYNANRDDPPVDFFADEYRLNAMIDAYPKPYIALIDGIVMGGGVGISFHGSHRVLTENAVFAMPEVGIGFFPDVGGSHLLSDLGGSFGMYLGLTGNRIRYGDALWSGLANYTMQSQYQAGLLERLAETGEADLALREVFSAAKRETDAVTLQAIAHHFSRPSLKEIVDSLDVAAPADEFAAKTLATIRTRSPTSLHVAFKQITLGSTKSMDECMRMEFRILNRMLKGRDFYEGIRVVLVNKGDQPRWDPPALEAVDQADIHRYFEPLGTAELRL
jgi:enoyl-CoA hydratase/carnithine racemase